MVTSSDVTVLTGATVAPAVLQLVKATSSACWELSVRLVLGSGSSQKTRADEFCLFVKEN